MSGKISSRFNETLSSLLKKEHSENFLSLIKSARAKDKELTLWLGGEDSRTETEKLPNGDLQVSFFIPLDNDKVADPTNGTLYLVDRYTFHDANHQKFSFNREVVYNQRGTDKGKWRALRDFLNNPKNAAVPTPEQQAKFARRAALTFSRPIDTQVYQKIREFSGEEAKQVSNGTQPYYFLPLVSGPVEKARLSLRLKEGDNSRDRRAHITRIEKENGYEIVFSYVLNDKDPKTKGSLMVQDRFIFLEMDEPVAFQRDIVPANGAAKELIWKKLRDKFYQADGKTLIPELMPTEEGWRKFFSHMKAELLRFEPNYDLLAVERDQELLSELSASEMPSVSTDDAFARIADNKLYRPAADFEEELSKALAKQGGYLKTLSEAGGDEFPLELDRLNLDVQVQVKGGETFLKLRHVFADPSYDGVPRGRIYFTETYRFKGKTLEGIDRRSDYIGPDPDGRLNAVWTRLQAQLKANKFPDKDHLFTKQFLNETLSYLAPHVLVKSGEVALLELKEKETPLSPSQQEILKSLKQIETGLVSYLYRPGVDPRFRSKILRSIRDTLYQKLAAPDPTNPAEAAQGPQPFQVLALLSAAEQGPLEPIEQQIRSEQNKEHPDEKLLVPLRQKAAPFQERKALVDALLSILIGRTDKALGLLSNISSPDLRGVLEGTLGPQQRNRLNHEGLELMQAVGLDLIAQEAKASDKWFGGKPFNQAEAEKSLRTLIEKAHTQVDLSDGSSPLAVLAVLKDLTEGEKAERSRLNSSRLIGQLNGIAQEKVQDGRGRQYFTFAKSLKEAGLVASADFVGRWVARHHMPPTRSMEGLKVLEALGHFRLQSELAKGQEEKLSELTRITKALIPEELNDGTLSPEEREQILKEFQEKYPQEHGYYNQTFKFLTDPKAFFHLDEANRQAFLNGLIQAYGNQTGFILLGHQAQIFSSDSFASKAQQEAATHPEKSFKDLLMGLQGLQPGEESIRKIILEDPQFTELIEQTDGLRVEIRPQAFQKILTILKDALIDSAQKIIARPFLDKMEKDLAPGMGMLQQQSMVDLFLRSQAQQLLLAKAREKAATNPEMNPLEVIRLVNDEELDKELAEGLKKLDPHDKQFEEKKEGAEQMVKAIKRQRNFLADETAPISKALSKIFAEGNAVKRLEKYRKFFGENIARKNYLELTLGQKTGEVEIEEEVVKSLLAEANFSDQAKAVFEAIKKAEDQEKLKAALGGLRNVTDFEFTPYFQVIQLLDKQRSTGEFAMPSAKEVLEANPQLKEEERVHIRGMAATAFPSHDLANFLAHNEGRGGLSYKIEYGIPALFKEVSKPTMLAAMTGAMALGPATEAVLFARLGGAEGAALIWGSRAATVGGIATEGLVLNTGHKILDSAFITKKEKWENYWGDQLTTWGTFGLWRGAHGLVGSFGKEVLATGKVGRWAGGPAVVHEVPFTTTPLGRLQMAKGGADGVIYQTTRAGAAVEGILQHSAGIGSIMLAHAGATQFQLQPESEHQGFSDRVFDATSMYLTGLIGARVVQGALPSLGNLQTSVAMARYRNEMRRLEKEMEGAKPKSDTPELVDHKIFKDQLDALQKKAEEISKERAEPTLPAEVPGLRLALEYILGEKAVAEMEFKVEDGKVCIRDLRKDVEKGKEDIQIDGQPLVRHQWFSIPENVAIKTSGATFRLGQPAHQEITSAQLAHLKTLQFLSKVDLSHQESLARAIESARDLAALQKSLSGSLSAIFKHGELDAGTNLAQLIRWVQMGAYPLEVLPTQLGLRGKVTELLEAEIAATKRDGLDIESLQWREDNLPAVTDPIQMSYIKARFVRQLDEAIARTKSLDEISELLGKVPLEKIEGKSVDALRADLPSQATDIQMFGLGQRVADFGKDPSKISGLPHSLTLNRLVRKHLDGRTPGDLASTQNVLRYHLDHMTPNARVMLSRGGGFGGLSSAHKKGLIDLYLGKKGKRVVASETVGFEIISGLTHHGVPYPMTLSVETVHGKTRTVLRKGDAKPEAQLLVHSVGKELKITGENPETWNSDPGNPSGWHRARPYIPKLPPLPAAVHMPKVKMPKGKVPVGLGNLLHGKTPGGNSWRSLLKRDGKSSKEEQAKRDEEDIRLDELFEESPATMQSGSKTPDSTPQKRAELQIQASQELNKILASFGKFTDGQEISIEIGDGLPLKVYLKFVVDLPSRQVRMSEATVTDLKNTKDMVTDPKAKDLYEGLIEMKDQPFSLPTGE